MVADTSEPLPPVANCVYYLESVQLPVWADNRKNLRGRVRVESLTAGMSTTSPKRHTSLLSEIPKLYKLEVREERTESSSLTERLDFRVVDRLWAFVGVSF